MKRCAISAFIRQLSIILSAVLAFGLIIPANRPSQAAPAKYRILQHAEANTGSFERIDEQVRSFRPAQSIQEVESQIKSVARTPWEKTRAIYVWLADNIAYDTEAFFNREESNVNPDDVFREHKSVCQGYSDLFVKIGSDLGLKVVGIAGYGKGYGFSHGQPIRGSNHAWNAVKLDGEWHLFDSTWGAGAVNGERKFVKQFSDFWFDTDPRLFLYTHFPEEKIWQLAGSPISRDQFARMKYIPAAEFQQLYAYGFSSGDILRSIKDDDGFPQVYSLGEHAIRIARAPVKRDLNSGDTVEIAVESSDALGAALINNGRFIMLNQNGNTFTGAIAPEPGRLCLGFRYGNAQQYQFALAYYVK
jgi:hypothetical protein